MKGIKGTQQFLLWLIMVGGTFFKYNNEREHRGRCDSFFHFASFSFASLIVVVAVDVGGDGGGDAAVAFFFAIDAAAAVVVFIIVVVLRRPILFFAADSRERMKGV